MTEAELYKELGILTRSKDRWKENIPYVWTLLHAQTIKITAKALWLLGEMGLVYPREARDFVPTIASFLKHEEALLRERSVNALGRIGRADYEAIKPFWHDMFSLSEDSAANVRLNFIWASENIATNTPDIYEEYMDTFAKLLNDSDDRVRMEAPEIFRVLGKRKPDFVRPYLEKLTYLSENDNNRVVRIHSVGAIKTTKL